MRLWTLILSVVSFCFLAASQAQVVREEGVVSIAGLLEDRSAYDVYRIDAEEEGLILFASIDSSIYQSQGRGGSPGSGGCEDDTCTESSSVILAEGTCTDDPSDGCDHDTSDGCSGSGGPLNLKLEVYLNDSDDPICHAGRPMYPGWQRDPRLICFLDPADRPAEVDYYELIVKVGGMGGEEEALLSESDTVKIPYLLNVSLRPIAGSDLTIEEAASASKNKF